MQHFRKIEIVDRILLVIEFLTLRLLRLIWIPPIPEEQNVEKKVVIVTGANTGLGKRTAKRMVERGATVVFACRNLVEGQKAIDEIKTQTGASKDKMMLMKLDLSDLNSIQEFSTALHKKFNAIDILINNAGLANMTGKRAATKDGFEIHMGVNHLGPFLLTNLLLDILKKGTQPRIVTVASHLHLLSEFDINDLMMETHFADVLNKKGHLPYCNTKFANVLFNLELAKKLEGSGITCYATCPGLVATGLLRDLVSWSHRIQLIIRVILIGVTTEIGCQPTLYCALSNKCKNQSGKVYHYHKELSAANKILQDSKSKQMATELWEKSEKLVDLKTRLK